MVQRILRATTSEKPRGKTHWSTRSLARQLGVSHLPVQRVWTEHELQPHRTWSFKLSTDPRFVEKLIDGVGPYMHPPERAVIFSADEKPQVQALERTRAVLPMAEQWPEGRPHDYRRHGKIDLYAALSILDDHVTHAFYPRHHHQEFLVFLRILDQQVPADLSVGVMLNKLSAHKIDEVERWLCRHRRFRFHFVPTGSSWVDMVEEWFTQVEEKTIYRGSFTSVPVLKATMKEFVAASNGHAEPRVWTKDVNTILKKVARIRPRMGLPPLILSRPISSRVRNAPSAVPYLQSDDLPSWLPGGTFLARWRRASRHP